jgi:hypothetical protein
MTIVTLKSKPLNICPTKLTRLKMPWVGLPQCCVWVFDSVNNSLFKLFGILPIEEPPVLFVSKNHTESNGSHGRPGKTQRVFWVVLLLTLKKRIAGIYQKQFSDFLRRAIMKLKNHPDNKIYKI